MYTFSFSIHLLKRACTGTILFLGLLGLFIGPFWLFSTIVAGLFFYIAAIELPRLFAVGSFAFWAILLGYIALPFACILALQYQGYETVNLLLITLVASHDVGSYMIGKSMGKNKISPAISPGKTWEGFLGGFFCTLMLSLFFIGPTLWSLPLALLVCSCALAGDLFESVLKRNAGLKDSGSILPGHGGLLDRIDGLLVVTPAFYILRFFIKELL